LAQLREPRLRGDNARACVSGARKVYDRFASAPAVQSVGVLLQHASPSDRHRQEDDRGTIPDGLPEGFSE
jgi:hypothetical protein